MPPDRNEPLRVAILGAGLIGIDLLLKIRRSPLLDCRLVVGRQDGGLGLRRAADLGCATAGDGIRSLVAADRPFDIVFDASNAVSHVEHWKCLEPLGTRLVDLTPSMVGHMVAPTVNGADAAAHRNINLISCTGQAAVPILHALTRHFPTSYIEVVTTAASSSVGRATRLNLDEYIGTTQDAVRTFTGVPDVKVMVNLSPASPPTTFRVALSVLGTGFDADAVRHVVSEAAAKVSAFAPGFAVKACTAADDRVFVAVEVAAAGDRIPRHVGNLDIINSAAVLIAERCARDSAPATTLGVS
ncbi:acetylating acetaldehyde dehydrogenase [Streptomyces paromomycinus]|uniref:Acetaldehyde dehydrogenase n=1 Tax=Streptomyces paromomycinus TaxID=92743 RepID=A0A401VWC3_STREY|nr:acetaldehyde dehydrogenase (acetylating) [Streptomyces paromomycinus]GCD41365.1 acetaldehyde dehydrogenase [Streptomyces paromomycinus]